MDEHGLAYVAGMNGAACSMLDAPATCNFTTVVVVAHVVGIAKADIRRKLTSI